MDGYIDKKRIDIPDGYDLSDRKNFERYVSHLDNIENHQFERAKLDAQNKHIENLEEIKSNGEKDKLKIQLGWVGLCFGGSRNVSFNIVGVLIFLMIIFCVACSVIIYFSNQEISDKRIQLIEKVWEYTIPVITLSLGYIFGKKNEN